MAFLPFYVAYRFGHYYESLLGLTMFIQRRTIGQGTIMQIQNHKWLRKTIHACYDIWEKIGNQLGDGKTGPIEQEREVKSQADEIRKNILRKKLILCDKASNPDYTQEHTRDDTLEYAKNQMEEAIKSEALKKLADLKKDTFRDPVDTLKEKHKSIVALTRLLILPNTLDRSLSTRDAGILVALA